MKKEGDKMDYKICRQRITQILLILILMYERTDKRGDLKLKNFLF